MKKSLVIRQFELGQLANFNYIMGDLQTKEVALIDPCDETGFLLEAAQRENFKIIAILLTHGHFDHVGGVIELSADLSIPVYLSQHEASYYKPDCKRLLPVQDNEKVPIGSFSIDCLHTPGHTPGCQCFYVEGNLFTGDTLFIDAIGRTDLIGGNTTQLFQSLQRIKQLPDTTVIWPGHNYGVTSHQTLTLLKRENPYLACDSLEEFSELVG